MARSSDPIVAYIETLYANRELVSQAYHDGLITETSENSVGVRALEHACAIRGFDEDDFKLTRQLQNTLDAATFRVRSYDRLMRVSPKLDRLRRLVTSMIEARRAGQTDDMADAAAEFEDECFSIREDIRRNIYTLRSLIDSDFATARSLSEKERQNRYYINETEDVQNDVLRVVEFDLPSTLMLSELYDFSGVFSRMVSQHLQAWQVQLAEIWKTIRLMLFKTREVQQQNSNFAKALLLFQLHPRYEGPEVPVDDGSPAWLFKIDPIPIRPNIDVRFAGTEMALAAIAESVPATRERQSRPEDFTPQPVLEDTGPKEVELEPELYDIAHHFFFVDVRACADPMGVSAYLWKFRRPEFDELSMDVWLQCLMIESEDDKTDEFAMNPVYDSVDPGLAGTREFTDLSVSRRVGISA
jgi:hypothetical protein